MTGYPTTIEDLKREAKDVRERLSLELAYELGKQAAIKEIEDAVRESIENATAAAKSAAVRRGGADKWEL